MGLNDKPAMSMIDLEHFLIYVNNCILPSGLKYADGSFFEKTWKQKIREWYRLYYRINKALDIEQDTLMVWEFLVSTEVLIKGSILGSFQLTTLLRSPCVDKECK